MPLIVEITEGIQKGAKFKLAPGTTFGRRQTDVIIKDPNVSSRHAQVLIDQHDQLFLQDLNSKNGLIFNNEIVRTLHLANNVAFIIGDTPFLVLEISDKDLEKMFPSKSWEEKFSDYMKTHSPKTLLPEKVQPFNPMLELHFIQGLQYEEVITVGYGPRVAGFYSFDIPINDEVCPELAFKLIPDKKGIKILNCSLDKVLLNDNIFESAFLSSGDKIKIGSTIIKVLFSIAEKVKLHESHDG